MPTATVTVEYKGHEFTGTVEIDGPHDEVQYVTIDDHDADDSFVAKHQGSIESEIEDAGYAVIKAKRERVEAGRYYDDEESYEGFDDSFDEMWG